LEGKISLQNQIKSFLLSRFRDTLRNTNYQDYQIYLGEKLIGVINNPPFFKIEEVNENSIKINSDKDAQLYAWNLCKLLDKPKEFPLKYGLNVGWFKKESLSSFSEYHQFSMELLPGIYQFTIEEQNPWVQKNLIFPWQPCLKKPLYLSKEWFGNLSLEVLLKEAEKYYSKLASTISKKKQGLILNWLEENIFKPEDRIETQDGKAKIIGWILNSKEFQINYQVLRVHEKCRSVPSSYMFTKDPMIQLRLFIGLFSLIHGGISLGYFPLEMRSSLNQAYYRAYKSDLSLYKTNLRSALNFLRMKWED